MLENRQSSWLANPMVSGIASLISILVGACLSYFRHWNMYPFILLGFGVVLLPTLIDYKKLKRQNESLEVLIQIKGTLVGGAIVMLLILIASFQKYAPWYVIVVPIMAVGFTLEKKLVGGKRSGGKTP